MTRNHDRGWPRRPHVNHFPVPHPSWRAVPEHEQEKLSAQEFWARLGL